MRQSLIKALAVALVLSACTPGISRKAPDVVKIPVPTMPTPHDDLLSCGYSPPKFQFEAVEERPDYVQLSPDGQHQLKEWIDGKQDCIRAWRAWAAPNRKP